MARLLRTYGVHYLGKPAVVFTPSVQQQQRTIRTQFAVQARVDRQRKCAPSIEARHPWLTFVSSTGTGFVRNFTRTSPLAASDSIQLAPPASSGFGTLLALVRRGSDENHAVLSFDAAGPSAVAEFFVRDGGNGNLLAFWNGSTTSQGTVALAPSEGWALIAITKATGSATPRFHKCVLPTGVWTHADATTGAIANWPSTWASAWLGTSGDGFDFLNGTEALAAFFGGNALSDVALEALTSLNAIIAAAPTALWVLDQPSASIPVNDFNGPADQTGISGTVAVADTIPTFNKSLPLGVTNQFIGIRPPVVVGPVAVPATQQQQTLRVALAGRDHDRTRRAPHSKLRPPTVVTPFSAFIAEPLSVELAQTRPRRTTKQLRPPTVLQVFAGPATRLVRARPRATLWDLRPPQVVRVPSVEQEQQTISVRLVRGRAGKTDYRLNLPTVVRVPSVEQQQQTIRVRLVRGRRPETRSLLFPPTVVTTPVVQIFYTGRPVLVRTRPQPTTYTLEPPTTLQVFAGPRSELTKTRPRPTVYKLRGPQVVRVPSVEQEQQTIRVALVRGRPGKTRVALFPPAVVAPPVQPFVAYAIRVELTRARPRHTVWTFRPPQVVRVPSVEQQLRTLRVRLVRTRPRPTTRVLRPPVVVLVPSVQQQQRTVRDWLVRARPRHTTTALRPPTVVRTIGPPARKALVQTRPRPTIHVLRPPTMLRVFEQGAAALTRIRPRHTIWQLRPPTVVAPFVAAIETTLHRWLVRIRPPQTRPQKPAPPFAPTVPGKGCLTDQLANQGCLTDGLAAVACLTNQAGTAGCLTDQAGTSGCLVDLSAATATLRDEN